MGETFRGYSLNVLNDPPPNGAKENALFKSILAMMPDRTSDITNVIIVAEHKHYRIYNITGSDIFAAGSGSISVGDAALTIPASVRLIVMQELELLGEKSYLKAVAGSGGATNRDTVTLGNTGTGSNLTYFKISGSHLDSVVDIGSTGSNLKILTNFGGGESINTLSYIGTGTSGGRFGLGTVSPATALEITANAGGTDKGGITFSELSTDITAPAANKVVLYAKDNGAGKTQLMALFSSGAAQQVAIQP